MEEYPLFLTLVIILLFLNHGVTIGYLKMAFHSEQHNFEKTTANPRHYQTQQYYRIALLIKEFLNVSISYLYRGKLLIKEEPFQSFSNSLKRQITAMLAGSANGYTFPPQLIFKGKQPEYTLKNVQRDG